MRKSFAPFLGAVLAASFATGVAAQAYPTKPIRLVSPLSPGGGNDTLSRFIGKHLTASLGQQVVVENRPGAGGIVGGQYVANAAPDGYTLLTGGSGQIVSSLNHKGRIDMTKDFTPIVIVGEYASLLATHPSLPVKSVADIIRLAKSQPGQINFGSAGTGSAGHLMMEMFRSMADIDIVHVPYKGAAPALVELMAGQVSMVFNNPLGSIGHVRAGRLRAVAVSSPRRIAALPDVPTVAESGLPGFSATLFLGLLGPAGLPSEVVRILNTATVKVLARKDVRELLEKQGMEAVGGSPEQFSARIRADLATYGEIIDKSKAR